MTSSIRLVAALALVALAGCTFHSTDSTEVGVLTREATFFGLLGHPGIQPDVYLPGTRQMFFAFTTRWNTFDVALQNLEMLRDPKTGDRSGEDDLSFKTIDGNDIRVDVTVAWQIAPKMAPYLLSKVGSSTEEVKDRLVRPACRSVVRDVLNELRSEEFYVADKRFAKANEAKDRLDQVLGPEGVVVSQVILGEHHFHAQYEAVIHDKKLAEQNTEKVRSEAKAAAEQYKSELEKAKGTVAQQLATAQGQLDTVKLQADAALFQNEQRAKAIVIERTAEAEAIKKTNAALASQGGRTMVELRIADALQGKRLVFVPAGKGGAGLQTLNLNQLLGAYAVQDSAGPATEAKADAKSNGGGDAP